MIGSNVIPRIQYIDYDKLCDDTARQCSDKDRHDYITISYNNH